MMSTTSNEQPLSVVVGWLDAMRREDPDAIAAFFQRDVTWRGVPEGALCRNHDEVMDMLEDLRAAKLPRPDALELIDGNVAVVLGVRSNDLREIGGVALPGQLYNVFEIRDGRIASVRDFIRRTDALNAAAARAPDWT